MKRFMVLASILIIAGFMGTSCTERHEIHGKEVEYTADGGIFAGYISYDKIKKGKRPGVLVVHEWWGQNSQVRERADMLAELGYTALVVDMYGGGRQASSSDDAAELAKEVSENADVKHERFMTAMNFLRQQETVDADNIAAIGYSFGGNIVLQMALDGLDLDGVVSFYGGLLVNVPADSDNIKAKILILQGEKDWYVTPQMISQFDTDMKNAGADYEMIMYKEAEHGFSNPDSEVLAEKFKGMHIVYNEEADRKSWQDMQKFLESVFHKL